MKDRQHVLIVGGESRLGAAIARVHARSGDEVLVTSRRASASEAIPLDLAAMTPDWRPPSRCDVAYICAGATSIQQCEAQPHLTARVNIEGTLTLCRALAKAGVLVVFFSTNLVFDGQSPHMRADAPSRPQCEYGRQKAQMESALIRERIPSLVIRLTKVIDPSHPLIRTWVEALSRGDAISPFTDMTMAPIALDDVVKTTIAAAAQRHRGILQLSAVEDISYFIAASHLARRLGADPHLVHANSARATLPPGRFIPRYTTMAAATPPLIRFAPPDPISVIDACLAGMALSPVTALT